MSDIMETAQGSLGRVVAIRLHPGTDVLLGLTEACRRFRINNGVILSAIGSLDTPHFCDVVELPTAAGYGYGETLHLTGPIELTGACGIICHDDGGHLVEGTKVLLTTDIVIAEIDGLIMGRRFDEKLKVPLFEPRQG